MVMENPDYTDLEDEIIDITPTSPPPSAGGKARWFTIAVPIVLGVLLWNAVNLYTEVLWFDSIGLASRYWYSFSVGWIAFLVFAVLTFAMLGGGFMILQRFFGAEELKPRKIVINNKAVDIDPGKIIRPLGWIIAVILSLGFALSLSSDWELWILYLNQPVTAVSEPIFGNSLGFYLFTLPVYNLIASWLTGITVILLAASVLYATLSALPNMPKSGKKQSVFTGFSQRSFGIISAILGVLFLIIAWRVVLSRYEYLWTDHDSFSGVRFTEANYLIPGLMIVAVFFGISAVILFINAFTRQSGRILAIAPGFPAIVFLVAVLLVPSYVQNFIVKPNELDRETPYIEHNIAGTRAGFNIDHVELREYAADITTDSFSLDDNRSTLDNIRLWDWNALQDTLRQIQEIRTYYDFPDVDVDRYEIGGETRQVMIATREMDTRKLPEQSRNWINERLVYTHGYGVTMNLVNEFTSEGKPRFILSNMPIESTGDVKVTRPEIYFGERTDTTVYVNTKQREFDYPQGENNNYSNYEGTGGFAVGSGLRRLAIAWTVGDLSKLPFSDDVSAESRVLMHRNINDRMNRIAPFLKYDDDPYMVINDDGRLFWMVDGFTTAAKYPYSRHYDARGENVNYIRNSVKITIDAYNGDINYYIFDAADPIIAAYRGAFPKIFKDVDEMPAGLRKHVRYPETLIKIQGDVFGLYHTTSPKMFFGREDVWSVAREAVANNGEGKALDPYQVLMPLPGFDAATEFAQVLPFTPANRNNMIAWMAGRSDGDAYGQLIVYNFPSSRVIDGPSQIEARIDQNAQLAGQITLWNQQGSKVKRGNLIIMPIGKGLLFIEPIYLQAERSPMPELRFVVLATQERLVYAENFEAALQQLMGDTSTKSAEKPETEQPESTVPSTVKELIENAGKVFADYQRLTSEGRLGEAGQKLEELKRILGEMQGR